MPKKMRVRIASAVMLLLVASALSVAAPSSFAANIADIAQVGNSASSTTKYPRTIANKKVNANKGGVVRAKNGVGVRVPAHVMRKSGRVSIREVAPGVYDIHITPRWNGHVSVSLPLTDGMPAIAHRVKGSWRFEDAVRHGNVGVAQVSSLSQFSAIGKCIVKLRRPGPGAALNIVLCFKEFAVKVLPEWIGKKLVGLFNEYDACKPISTSNWTIDWLEFALSSCPLGEPPRSDPPVPTPTPPQPPSPSPAPGQTSYRYYVYHTCANGACGLKVRSGPGFSGYPQIDTRYDGDAVDIVCQTRGESVSGTDGTSSNVWDKIAAGGYVADFYVNTPGMTGSFSPPIPNPC